MDVRETLAVGNSIVLGSSTGGSGALIIQTGGTLTGVLGAIGNAPGSQGTVTVTGPGSTWTNTGTLVVGGLGTGHPDHPGRRSGEQWGGGSVGLAVGSLVR